MKICLAAIRIASDHGHIVDTNTNLLGCISHGAVKMGELEYYKQLGPRNGLRLFDSGAFGFIKSKVHDIKTVDKFFERYLCAIEENLNDFDYFVELDVQPLLGEKKVRRFREEIIRRGLNHRCIHVWHTCSNWKYYLDMLVNSESGYVGIESPMTGKGIRYNKFIKEAYDRGIKIHGFGMTGQKTIMKHPFYSVDSSSAFRRPKVWGVINIFINGKMKTFCTSKENEFIKYAPYYTHSKFRERESWQKKYAWQEIQYRKMERFMTRFWERQGIFWEEQVGGK